MIFFGLEKFADQIPEKHRFGPSFAPKREILRVSGETNIDFLLYILLYNLLSHAIHIISHSTHFRLFIVKFNLPCGFGQLLASIKILSNLGTLMWWLHKKNSYFITPDKFTFIFKKQFVKSFSQWWNITKRNIWPSFFKE